MHQVRGAGAQAVSPDRAVGAHTDQRLAGKVVGAQLDQEQLTGPLGRTLDRAAVDVDRCGGALSEVVAGGGALRVQVVEGAVHCVFGVQPQPTHRDLVHPAALVAQGQVHIVDHAVRDCGHATVALDPLDEVACRGDVLRKLDRGHGTVARIDLDELSGRSGADPHSLVRDVQTPGVVAALSHGAVLGELRGSQVHRVQLGVRVGGAVQGVTDDVDGAQHLFSGDPDSQLGELSGSRVIPPHGAVVRAADAQVHLVVLGHIDRGRHRVGGHVMAVQHLSGAQVQYGEADRFAIGEDISHRCSVREYVHGGEAHVRCHHGHAQVSDRIVGHVVAVRSRPGGGRRAAQAERAEQDGGEAGCCPLADGVVTSVRWGLVPHELGLRSSDFTVVVNVLQSLAIFNSASVGCEAPSDQDGR